MSNKQVELAVKTRDAFAMLTDAWQEYVESLAPPEVRENWIPEKIVWVERTGQKGLFEQSEDFNNPEFKAMLRDISSHGGKLSRDGVFYWVFQNGSTVGRKHT
jgi:hypothetical protein